MAYQMTVTLTDQEYQLLALEASKSGKQPEMLLHDMIRGLQASSQEQHLMTGRELAEKLYREGKLASLATQHSLSKEEQEEILASFEHKISRKTLLANVEFGARFLNLQKSRITPGQAKRVFGRLRAALAEGEPDARWHACGRRCPRPGDRGGISGSARFACRMAGTGGRP